MLMADGRHQLPANVVANNFINFRLGDAEEKVSKSKTAADSPVWIEEFSKRFDPDALRYYLTRIAPESARTAFSLDDFYARNNSELADKLGNFVNRTLAFCTKYLDGKVPSRAAVTDADRAHLAAGRRALDAVGASIDAYRFRAALEELMAFADACNQFFGAREPWKSRKENAADCAASIATCIDCVQILGVLCWPFMPTTSERIRRMLAEPESPLRWAPPEPLPAGHAIREPEILFRKLLDAEEAGK